MAVFVVALGLTSTAGLGVGLQAPRVEAAIAAVPLAFYITDAPAKLTGLDVKITSVTAGADRIPMQVMQPAFDLAALQGPGAAILLAQGIVPADAAGSVEVTFASARATVDDQVFDVPLSQTLRVEGMTMSRDSSPAFLIDVDLPSSLAVGPDGRLRFAPVAKAVLAGPSPVSGAEPSWSPVNAVAVVEPTDLEPAGIVAPSGHDWIVQDPAKRVRQNPADDVPIPVNSTNLRQPITAGAIIEQGTTPGWLVMFDERENMTRGDMRSRLANVGATFVTSLESLPVAYILATPEQAQLVANLPGVARVEAEVPIVFHDAESRTALRLPAFNDPVSGLRDAQGRPIDGHGVGVAVVDTGIDALHPAFQNSEVINPAIRQELPGESVVAQNLKVVSQAFIPLPSTDTTSGHGTHVTAILAGQAGSDEALPGVAPGVSVYGLGVGEASSIVWAAQAFDWVLRNHDTVDPPIRVVSNSWGSQGTYDPNSVISRLVDRMVRNGITVVFSAGNEGGDGSTVETTAECQIPTPGVICVAAYDDQGTGTRDGSTAPYSSRGLVADASTWPDLSAPGTSVRSARAMAGSVTGVGVYRYVELSGTSQAAPHVAGVAALMLQMDGSLSPADVEGLLKASAHRFADGGAYDARGHYAKGHGLVDAYAAVAQAS